MFTTVKGGGGADAPSAARRLRSFLYILYAGPSSVFLTDGSSSSTP